VQPAQAHRLSARQEGQAIAARHGPGKHRSGDHQPGTRQREAAVYGQAEVAVGLGRPVLPRRARQVVPQGGNALAGLRADREQRRAGERGLRRQRADLLFHRPLPFPLYPVDLAQDERAFGYAEEV
jgi:hypothetical protein